MKFKFPGVALTFILLAGRVLGASEWTDWNPISGQSGDKDGQVEKRSILDESSLVHGTESGYRFHYELRNLSSTETAQVTLHFPASNTTATHELRPGATDRGSGLSPNPTNLEFEFQINWEKTSPPKNQEPLGNGEPPASTPPGSSADERYKNDPVLGIPLANNDALADALRGDPDHRYSAVIALVKPDNYDGNHAPMEKFIDDISSWCDECHERYGWRMKVISTDAREVQVLFEDMAGPDMAGFVMTTPVGVRRVLKLTRLGANGTEETVDSTAENSVKPEAPAFQGNGPLASDSRASKDLPWKPSAVAASAAKPTPAAPAPPPEAGNTPKGAHHEGYWFDPDDEGADDPDFVMYVRLNGVAERMPFSEARDKHSVPADATPQNMTVYSEKLKKIITNRHTQKRQ